MGRKKRKQTLIKEILLDPLHWLGWIITAFAIIITFHFLDVHLHVPYYNVLILTAVVVVVDVFKHTVELQ